MKTDSLLVGDNTHKGGVYIFVGFEKYRPMGKKINNESTNAITSNTIVNISPPAKADKNQLNV
ncbi:MAG TPA: hypothetical protein VNX01_13565 [Bacteroidia bacterium]|nr:hypothetical protein [Bacteroidia bacterium]